MLKRGLLLDRDGVINIDHGYVGHKEQFTFIPGVLPFLRAASGLGYRLAILTNQSGVARGLYTEADFELLTKWMLKELGREAIVIDLVLACFEHQDAKIEHYKRESYWRKPNAGMVLDALQRLRLDPERSAFLGDHERDMMAAKAAGIKTRLLLSDQEGSSRAYITVKNYDAALTELRTNIP